MVRPQKNEPIEDSEKYRNFSSDSTNALKQSSISKRKKHQISTCLYGRKNTTVISRDATEALDSGGSYKFVILDTFCLANLSFLTLLVLQICVFENNFFAHKFVFLVQILTCKFAFLEPFAFLTLWECDHMF